MNNTFGNIRIAALMTCHNRCEKTVECIRSLYSVHRNIEIYLTDDASTDNTYDTINSMFPEVHILQGNGNLYWNRGMHNSWKVALAGDYDYYLWVNDDIVLYLHFLDEMIHCAKRKEDRCIVSGIIEDIGTKEVIYGGCDSNKALIKPSIEPQAITYMNGNLVIVPKEVVKVIGILDPALHHDLGDVDYGLTAIEHNIPVLSTTTIVAGGYKNDYCRVRRWGTNMIERFKTLGTPLGSPLHINYYFRKKHFGHIQALAFCLHLIAINILPDIAVNAIWGDKYIDK